MAIASLVLGIISLCMSILSLGSLGFIGCICAVLGIIFGALGKNDEKNGGMAKAGLICSIIALCFGLLLLVLCAGAVGCMATL
ncbi:MAG: hypothetical protein SPJ34_09710 [Candidatus Ornithospirochaeta sp.]|nr:hypothetical protein [Candidatus Ornithospirochaeta sp.]